MRYAICLIALGLCACTQGLQIVREYAGGRMVEVPVDVPRSSIDAVRVTFHPTEPGRAIVRTTAEFYADQWSTSLTDAWVARVAEYREVYAAALLEELQKSHRPCVVGEAIPFPDAFMYEFRYRCAP